MKQSLFDPKKLLPEFDRFLHIKGVKFKAVVISFSHLSFKTFLQGTA